MSGADMLALAGVIAAATSVLMLLILRCVYAPCQAGNAAGCKPNRSTGCGMGGRHG